jgi:putative addiction module CopG family antidote
VQSLTPELERFVDDKVESGLYNNASEVVREGFASSRNTTRCVCAGVSRSSVG